MQEDILTTSVAVSEQYNGTSWTETNDLNTASYDMQRFGTATAAFHSGGECTTYFRHRRVLEWNFMD